MFLSNNRPYKRNNISIQKVENGCIINSTVKIVKKRVAILGQMRRKTYLCNDELKKKLNRMNKLTTKEEEVMEHIWELGPCAPKDVQALYPEPQPHINTIATMFQSLERKKFLSHRAVGRGYIYEPAIKKEDYGRSKLGVFVDHYFKHSYLKLVETLVRDEKVNEQDLLDYLQELRNEKQSK